MQDPRFKNKLPEADSLKKYVEAYVSAVQEVLKSIDASQLDAAYSVLEKAIQKQSNIFVAGNGGSAAIADHLCCDWMKGIHIPQKPGLHLHSLTSNASLLTAIANDQGYESSFSQQVEMLGRSGDVLVLISSSGNSPNILRALEVAKQKQMTVIGMCGFNGGQLKEKADVCLYVPIHNYGQVEDAHQILMHTISQYLALQRDRQK